MNKFQNWLILCIFTLMVFLFNAGRRSEFFKTQLERKEEVIEKLVLEKCKLLDSLDKIQMTIKCPDCNKTIYTNELCSCKKKDK